jgi:hypothetical protein
MEFYVLRLVDWLPNAVRQTNQPEHISYLVPMYTSFIRHHFVARVF